MHVHGTAIPMQRNATGRFWVGHVAKNRSMGRASWRGSFGRVVHSFTENKKQMSQFPGQSQWGLPDNIDIPDAVIFPPSTLPRPTGNAGNVVEAFPWLPDALKVLDLNATTYGMKRQQAASGVGGERFVTVPKGRYSFKTEAIRENIFIVLNDGTYIYKANVSHRIKPNIAAIAAIVGGLLGVGLLITLVWQRKAKRKPVTV